MHIFMYKVKKYMTFIHFYQHQQTYSFKICDQFKILSKQRTSVQLFSSSTGATWVEETHDGCCSDGLWSQAASGAP